MNKTFVKIKECLDNYYLMDKLNNNYVDYDSTNNKITYKSEKHHFQCECIENELHFDMIIDREYLVNMHDIRNKFNNCNIVILYRFNLMRTNGSYGGSYGIKCDISSFNDIKLSITIDDLLINYDNGDYKDFQLSITFSLQNKKVVKNFLKNVYTLL